MFVVGPVAARECIQRRDTRDHRETARVGAAVPKLLAVAIGDRNRRIGNGLGAFQLGHPDQRILIAFFEMHREVGDEGNGGYVHRRIFIEEILPQAFALSSMT